MQKLNLLLFKMDINHLYIYLNNIAPFKFNLYTRFKSTFATQISIGISDIEFLNIESRKMHNS